MSTSDTPRNTLANGLGAATVGAQQKPTQPLGLGAFWKRPEVQGLYYNGKIIKVDGYCFVGCRFDNCVLQVNSDNFELVRCVIDGSTRIEYSSSIAKIIKLFVGRYHWAQQYFHSFFLPTKNPDGTETISERGL